MGKGVLRNTEVSPDFNNNKAIAHFRGTSQNRTLKVSRKGCRFRQVMELDLSLEGQLPSDAQGKGEQRPGGRPKLNGTPGHTQWISAQHQVNHRGDAEAYFSPKGEYIKNRCHQSRAYSPACNRMKISRLGAYKDPKLKASWSLQGTVSSG